MALEFLQQCMHFFGIIVPQFVGCLLGSYIMELMVTSSKSTYATCCAFQICYSLSLCAHGSPLLTHASARGTQTLKARSDLVSFGGHCFFLWVLLCTRFCLHPLSVSGGPEVWFCPFYSLVKVSPLPLDMGYIFFGEIQHSSVDCCSEASWNFGVLAVEYECTSFYSAILQPSYCKYSAYFKFI